MPPANLDALTYDLSMLARGTALAERMLVTWLEHMELSDKIADFNRLNQCIDSLTRLAAVRKSLIRLSILIEKYAPDASASQCSSPSVSEAPSVSSVPSVVEPSPTTNPTHPTDPTDPTNPTNPTHSDPSVSPSSEIRNRPAVYVNHGEPAIYPPDREPNLVETREVREVAALPPDKLAATLDRVNTDIAQNAVSSRHNDELQLKLHSESVPLNAPGAPTPAKPDFTQHQPNCGADAPAGHSIISSASPPLRRAPS